MLINSLFLFSSFILCLVLFYFERELKTLREIVMNTVTNICEKILVARYELPFVDLKS